MVLALRQAGRALVTCQQGGVSSSYVEGTGTPSLMQSKPTGNVARSSSTSRAILTLLGQIGQPTTQQNSQPSPMRSGTRSLTHRAHLYSSDSTQNTRHAWQLDVAAREPTRPSSGACSVYGSAHPYICAATSGANTSTVIATMHGTTALMSSRASENEMPPADHSAGDDGEMGRVGVG